MNLAERLRIKMKKARGEKPEEHYESLKQKMADAAEEGKSTIQLSSRRDPEVSTLRHNKGGIRDRLESKGIEVTKSKGSLSTYFYLRWD